MTLTTSVNGIIRPCLFIRVSDESFEMIASLELSRRYLVLSLKTKYIGV